MIVVVHKFLLGGVLTETFIERLKHLLLRAFELSNCVKRFTVALAERAVGGKDLKTLVWNFCDVAARQRGLESDRSREVGDAEKERSTGERRVEFLDEIS
jgi:hypothetical protein